MKPLTALALLGGVGVLAIIFEKQIVAEFQTLTGKTPSKIPPMTQNSQNLPVRRNLASTPAVTVPIQPGGFSFANQLPISLA